MKFALITWYQGQMHVVIWLSLKSLITGRFCNRSKVGLGVAICAPHPHTHEYQKKFKQAGRQIPRRVEFNEPVWIIRLHDFTIKALRSWDGGHSYMSQVDRYNELVANENINMLLWSDPPNQRKRMHINTQTYAWKLKRILGRVRPQNCINTLILRCDAYTYIVPAADQSLCMHEELSPYVRGSIRWQESTVAEPLLIHTHIRRAQRP